MIKYKNLIYGTVRECVEELWKLIDFENWVFPDFDFAAWADEDLTLEDLEKHGWHCGESWYGCKELGSVFNSDTLSLFFGHYGGGGVMAVEISDDNPDCKDDLIKAIRVSTGGELGEDDPTLFEILTNERR